MYTAVLMMALTTGGDAVNCGRGSCCGYSGGCGYSGCNSGCGYSGCGYSSGCGSCGHSCYSGCGSCGYSSSGSSGCGSCGYSGCGYSSGCSSCGYSSSGSSGCSSCGYSMTTGSGAYLAAAGAPATLIVSLPADAKLMIDDHATTSTSAQRTFVSPNIPTGQQYHYTLTAEVTVDGKPVVFSEHVTVKAGESTRVTLAPPSGVAAR